MGLRQKAIEPVGEPERRNGKETIDIRYFIGSLPMGVKRFAHAVRAHRGIENTCHWSLDITCRENESRIREKHLRGWP